MHESEKWKWSCSVVSDSSQPHGLQPTRLLRPWDFLGKSTGVGCHCLLHDCTPFISYSMFPKLQLFVRAFILLRFLNICPTCNVRSPMSVLVTVTITKHNAWHKSGCSVSTCEVNEEMNEWMWAPSPLKWWRAYEYVYTHPCERWVFYMHSVQFSHSVMSNSLPPHGLQDTRLPCPSPPPGVYSNSCPLSQWCHPTISSSIIPFSSRFQYFPASGYFPMSRFFTSGGQSIGVSASASVLPKNI